MIMLMIMPFTWQVFADESLSEEQGTSAVQSESLQPEQPKEAVKSVNEAPETSETPEAPSVNEPAEPAASETPAEPASSETPETPEAPKADEPADVEAAAVPGAGYEHEAEPDDVSAPKAADEDAEENKPVKTITIDGTSFDGSGDNSGNGWTYEKDSGRIVLRDYIGGADITSDGTGVEIVSTGYNRIGTLSCDGDINVIGAGILLVDKIELAKGCTFNLLPLREYYGEEGGSVAVFLLQEDGSYMLVNGTVKGVIDEKVELPEDVRLVMPADTMLELQAYSVKVETDEDGNRTVIRDVSGYSIYEREGEDWENYGGHLLTGDLTVNKGATIKNNNVGEEIVASIIVAGNLINEGLISGGSVTVAQKYSGEGGLYSGTGTIEDSYITLKTGQTMSINIKDSILNLEKEGDYTIEKLGLTGHAELYYGGNCEIKDIKGADDSSLNIYSFEITDNLKLTGTIDRTAVLIKSGITELAAALTNKGTIDNKTDNKNYGGPIFNYTGMNIVSDGTKGSVFIGPVEIPDQKKIPVVSFYLHKTVDYCWNITLEENIEEGQGYTILNEYNATLHSGKITYRDLIETYFNNDLDFLGTDESIIFEVLRCEDNKLSMTVLGDNYESETSAEGVFLIRLAYLAPFTNQHGGTTGTTTRASQTGSGNIGGNSKSIITGTGITRFSSDDPVDPDPDPIKPDPDPDPAPDPDPVKPDPDPIKPDPVKPDPVKPEKEYTVAAVTAFGDTLAIQINEFDLNEGEKNAGKVPYYNLAAYINGAQVSELGRTVEVEMDYVLPEDFRDKPLYAVFANEDEDSDEILKAVTAEYDEETETLSFETSQAGEFIVVALEFDGEEFSPEFYDELEKTEEAGLFIKHLEEKKKNAGL